MIPEFQHGDNLTIDSLNQLVAACNGEMIPDNQFWKTDRGHVANDAGNSFSRFKDKDIPRFLQCKKFVGGQLEARGEEPNEEIVGEYWHVNLGRDNSTMFELLDVLSCEVMFSDAFDEGPEGMLSSTEICCSMGGWVNMGFSDLSGDGLLHCLKCKVMYHGEDVWKDLVAFSNHKSQAKLKESYERINGTSVTGLKIVKDLVLGMETQAYDICGLSAKFYIDNVPRGGDGEVSVVFDTELSDARTSSVQWNWLSNDERHEGVSAMYAELYNFHRLSADAPMITYPYESDYYSPWDENRIDYWPVIDAQLSARHPWSKNQDPKQVLIRNLAADNDTAELQYRELSVYYPPFVIGDSDAWQHRYYQHLSAHANLACRSIHALGNEKLPYYELFQFTNPTGTLPVHTIKLEPGGTVPAFEGITPQPEFLMKWRDDENKNVLRYVSLEFQMTSCVTQDQMDEVKTGIGEISSRLDDFWECDGSYNTTCYGHSIGDHNNNKKISLDESQLVGDWSCDGSISAYHNIYAYDDCIAGNLYSRNLLSAVTGKFTDNVTIANNLSVGQHITGGSATLSGHMKTGTLGVDYDATVAEDLAVGGRLDVEQGIWTGAELEVAEDLTVVDGDIKVLGGDVECHDINVGHVLKIGDTTLNQSQLIQLLALIAT